MKNPTARRYVIVLALMTSLASLALVSPALAKEPTGAFAAFKECPRFTPGLEWCLFSQTTSGEVRIGKTAVPIENPITLQGGYSSELKEVGKEEFQEIDHFVGASNGETLSKTPQNVPGGLLGLVNCKEISNPFVRVACELTFERGLTQVTATTELAKPASEIFLNTTNLTNEKGVALGLPAKVKLDNAFLGPECYIGSSSSPININLTTGTTNPPAPNKPISGKLGNLEFKEDFQLIEITNNTLVDNAFSVPTANGCGGIFSFLIDPIINAKLGLPSAAGNNTAIENNTINQGTAEAVINSEK